MTDDRHRTDRAANRSLQVPWFVRSSPALETLLVGSFFLLVAMVITYPLITQAFTALPAGLGDPAFVTFVLAWDADRMAHAFQGFWDAPFLFPHRHTLAYSEHMLGVALFTAPLQWIARSPVLVYNVAFLGSHVLAGAGMYLLTRSLWGRKDAALLAGLMFMLCPYRLGQVTHLQVLLAGWMPIALWALHRYFATGSRRMLTVFAIAFLLQALSNGYFLFYFAIAAAVVIGVELVRPRLSRGRILADLVVAGMAIAVALAPFAWAYITVQRENSFDRDAEDLLHYSARLTDYLTVPPGGWTWGGLLASGAPERQLFPGFVALLLAVVGMLWIRRPTPPRSSASSQDIDARRALLQRGLPTDRGTPEGAPYGSDIAVVTYAILALVALWLSLGPGPWRIYGLLYRVVPGFSGMRVPARLATVVDLGVVVLAAAGAAHVLRRMSRGGALLVTIALALVVGLEGRQSISVDPFPPVERRLDRAAYEWLRDSPPGAAIELQIVQQNDFHPFTLFYMFNTLLHRHPIVNGYTGWSSVLQDFLGGPPSPFREPGRVAETLRGLRTIGVRYVLLHWRTYTDAEEPARLMTEIRAAPEQLVEERQFQSTFAWRLADAPPRVVPSFDALQRVDPHSFTATASQGADRLPLAFDGDSETRWLTGSRQTGHEWIEIRLGRQTDVARLRIETSPRGLVDYPRHLAIESTDAHGASRVLLDASILTPLIESLAADERRAPIDLDFPPNQTVTLRIRQTGQTRLWFWGVHELSVWERP